MNKTLIALVLLALSACGQPGDQPKSMANPDGDLALTLFRTSKFVETGKHCYERVDIWTVFGVTGNGACYTAFSTKGGQVTIQTPCGDESQPPGTESVSATTPEKAIENFLEKYDNG